MDGFPRYCVLTRIRGLPSKSVGAIGGKRDGSSVGNVGGQRLKNAAIRGCCRFVYQNKDGRAATKP